MRNFACIAAAGLGLALAASVSQGAEPTVDVAGIVQARQVAMNMSAYPLGDMRRSLQAGNPLSAQQAAASSVARWARAMPALFVAGSSAEDLPGQAWASPAVWSDAAGFRQTQEEFATRAERLVELSAGDDLEAFQAQRALVIESCNSCHAVYRVPRNAQ